MAGPTNSDSNFGLFVPTTNIWDTARLYEIDINSDEFKELLVRLYQNINNISIALNLKQNGYYLQQEFLSGKLWYPDPALNSTTAQSPDFRPVFRTVINFGALPNTASKSVAHNIPIVASTTTYKAVHIYGAATKNDQTSFIPIPYASPTLNENISLEITDADVIITTGIDRTAYTNCYVVFEYLK